ncbi:PCRF domain-containing protein, partial [Escherichia coli]|uniref:PCRF domain-containing protein n=1 Tax=Escherichia coli TaxID=562 RepID=UPI001365A266|nr:PCRF domain-containing protein [Escherichia coli]
METDRGVPGFRHEAGTHRIQRIPATESRGRIHSSTVTVSVLDGRRTAFAGLRDEDLSIRWFSGTGAGGQHRNRKMCSVEIRHIPTGMSRSAQTRSRESSMTQAKGALEKDVREHFVTQSNT